METKMTVEEELKVAYSKYPECLDIECAETGELGDSNEDLRRAYISGMRDREKQIKAKLKELIEEIKGKRWNDEEALQRLIKEINDSL